MFTFNPFNDDGHVFDRAIAKINCEGSKDSAKSFQKMKSEWKMAKIALVVILLFVISWAPYSCTALTAFAGYDQKQYNLKCAS